MSAGYDDGSTQNVGFDLEETYDEPGWGKLQSHVNDIPTLNLIGDDTFTIGRGDSSQIHINKAYISTVHCKIYRDPSSGFVYCEDCSSNGTFIQRPNASKSTKISKDKTMIESGTKIILVKKNEKLKIDEICFTFMANGETEEANEKYQVGKELGRGAFAAVFLGFKEDGADLKKVAIKKFEKKKLTNSQSSNPNSLDHVKQEANLLKKIQHKGVINFLDDYEDKDHYNIVMEYASGGELKEYLEKVKKLDENKARMITKQIIEVLQHLHNQGIVHRDLKLENILFEDETHEVIKLSDFGISKLVGEGVFLQTLCGTPDYLAPEIFRASESGYTSAVDMWSLGIIVYKLVTGLHPFKDDKKQTVMGELLDESFDFPTNVLLSPSCKDFIRKLLTKDPKVRMTAEAASQHPWLRKTSVLKRDRQIFKREESDVTETLQHQDSDEEKPAKKFKSSRTQ